MPFAIQTATPSDVPRLHALVESAYRGDSARQGWTHEADMLDGQRTDAEALSEIISDARQRILIATEEDRFCGCVQITDKGGGTAYLGLLSVDPALQAAGLGRQLINAAEAAAGDLFGASVMEMTVIAQRTELIDWYVRRGYEATGETRPFPHTDPRFGVANRPDLYFVVLAKAI